MNRRMDNGLAGEPNPLIDWRAIARYHAGLANNCACVACERYRAEGRDMAAMTVEDQKKAYAAMAAKMANSVRVDDPA